jgi:hypothetical protein
MRRTEAVNPIHIPEDWHDNDLLAFEQFCDLIHVPPRTVRDWRRRGVGPRWSKLPGAGRLYITIAEVRRFTRAASVTDRQLDRDKGRSA